MRLGRYPSLRSYGRLARGIRSDARFSADQPLLIEAMLKAIPESLANLIAPTNQSETVELIMNKLRIKDSLTAGEGYQDTVRTIALKPSQAVEGMRNVQRLLKTQNPRIGEVNVEDPIDSHYVCILDERCSFERVDGSLVNRFFSGHPGCRER